MELPNRSDLEEDFAKRFGKVARRHLHEFRELLGNPPDIENVPEEFWQKMEKESEHSVYPILLLIFGDSSELHGWTGPDALLAAYGFAALRSAAFAQQWTDSTRVRLSDGFEKLQTQSVSRDLSTIVDKVGHEITPLGVEIPVHGETVEQHREANRTSPRRQNTHTGQHRPGAVNRTTTEPGEIDGDELDELLEHSFGPKRVATNAIDEVTRGQFAGGEAAVEATVGISAEDEWRCQEKEEGVPDDKVCPLCRSVNRVQRKDWPYRLNDGPPCHPNDRCWVWYKLVDPVEAVRRMLDDPDYKSLRAMLKSHDVSGEARADDGKWTAGGASGMSTSKATDEAKKAIEGVEGRKNKVNAAKKIFETATDEEILHALDHGTGAIKEAAHEEMKKNRPSIHLQRMVATQNATQEAEQHKIIKLNEQFGEADEYLKKNGFALEHISGKSRYYFNKQKGIRVRVSDHDVPLTSERDHASSTGGFSWATSGNSVVLPVSDVHSALESFTK